VYRAAHPGRCDNAVAFLLLFELPCGRAVSSSELRTQLAPGLRTLLIAEREWQAG